MKILHIASFNGNMGDNANHTGFREIFSNILKENLEWENLEIRNFYKSWNIMKFNNDFVEYVNKFDLCIIGGGNFFEICHEYSVTGTTIDISKEILEKIKTPIFFNGLGFDTIRGFTEETKEKFKKFIEYLLENPQKYFVSFRNDGSKKNFEVLYGKWDSRIKVVADGGFFINMAINENRFPLKQIKQNYIGINIAMDEHKKIQEVSRADFIDKIVNFINDFIFKYPNYKIKFFPHIFSDIKIIYEVLERVSDKLIKYNIEIMPYLTGMENTTKFYLEYLNCKLILGMRFHTNVVGMSLNIPTIGLVSYSKMEDLYNEVDMRTRIIDIKKADFNKEILAKVIENLENENLVKKEYKEKMNIVKEKQEKIYEDLREWIIEISGENE